VRIAIVLFDGFDELDAIGPYEVLRNAARAGASVEVELVTLEPAQSVTAGHGLELLPQGVLDDGHDLVIVPGGGWIEGGGVRAQRERGQLPAELERLHANGTTMASVCTGAMVLSAAGITRGRPATTHHVALDALREEGAEVLDERVVDDGDLLTAAGVTSGIDMALWLVEREWGEELADGIARGMEYHRTGQVARTAARR
jgi:transcriptional regulator GlxA family with amidase domain